MELFFGDLGHQVESAATMDQALRRIPSARPDLLICDIGLPDGTGWELMSALLSEGHSPYAVAMSGFGMNADSARSREIGFRHHLLKPFSASELTRVLAEAEAEQKGGAR